MTGLTLIALNASLLPEKPAVRTKGETFSPRI
jgi:hypothetical protein